MEICALRMLSLNKESEQVERKYERVLRSCGAQGDYIIFALIENGSELAHTEKIDSRVSTKINAIQNNEWRESIRDWCIGFSSEQWSLEKDLDSGIWSERKEQG